VGLLGVVLALFTLGYILGVWTSALVFKQRQHAYEDAKSIEAGSHGGRR
jgi:hypothetical protein